MTRDSTRTTVVDHQYHWRPIDDRTPRGAKIQLISKKAGVAQYGVLSTDDNWFTHWAPLPTFEK